MSTYNIVINEFQRQVLVRALDSAGVRDVLTGFTTTVENPQGAVDPVGEMFAIIDMVKELPAVETATPGIVHDFTA